MGVAADIPDSFAISAWSSCFCRSAADRAGISSFVTVCRALLYKYRVDTVFCTPQLRCALLLSTHNSLTLIKSKTTSVVSSCSWTKVLCHATVLAHGHEIPSLRASRNHPLLCTSSCLHSYNCSAPVTYPPHVGPTMHQSNIISTKSNYCPVPCPTHTIIQQVIRTVSDLMARHPNTLSIRPSVVEQALDVYRSHRESV